MKMKEQYSAQKMISRPVLCFVLALACLIWFAGEAKAQRNAVSTEKRQSLSEMDKLLQEKNEIRKSRFKLLQDESAYQVQYFKPVDRLRRQLDTQENDLYAECSDGKDFKNLQYSFCLAELKRFNDDVKYYNERLDALKSGLISHKQEFNAKMDGLDSREREVDHKISSLKERPQR
ncbi:MAG: hypothetical protein PHT96_12425 [Syntrophorhabdaceae bacterium]|nr:hypothetical protein [Syntrophorhabdaceae bacterium]MDD4197192.1 hypothetical protein [Syntrophorhabdaceae bacterium]